ncbi:MAG: S8 family peptidase [Vicinamibacteria bacterium]
MQRVLVFAVACLGLLALARLPGGNADDLSGFAAIRRAGRPAPDYVPGQVLVGFASAAEQAAVERAAREIGARSAWKSPYGGHYVVNLPADVSVADAVASLRAMREVEYAEPNYVARAFLAPNDPFYDRQWNMKLINAERTWDIQKGSSEVVVAVLDTGVAFEDFGPYRKAPDWGSTRFVQGFDFENGDSHANDDNFHGTHVASTIAEATDNAVGVAGLAFGCALMPVKVLDAEGFGSFSVVSDGIGYAVANGAKVINLSLGGEFESQTLKAAIDRAVTAGVTVVAAAGNESTSTISFPAAFPNVIAVGAVDARKRRAPYSNTGSALDVVAPGGDIDRDDDDNGRPDGILQQTINPFVSLPLRLEQFVYLYVDGTSQATPHVAALAALLYSQGIKSPAAIQKAIESTAEDLGAAGRDDEYGHGLIRPAEALKGLGINK